MRIYLAYNMFRCVLLDDKKKRKINNEIVQRQSIFKSLGSRNTGGDMEMMRDDSVIK